MSAAIAAAAATAGGFIRHLPFPGTGASVSVVFLPPLYRGLRLGPSRGHCTCSLPPPLTVEKGDSTYESNSSYPVEEEEEAPAPLPLPRLPQPRLSVTERKRLSSYAHSLGKKLKSQQVGKSGVTASVAASFLETLEKNELIKLKVHGTCPGELDDVIRQLEESTGSATVDQIGRTVILYRPSTSKMKKDAAQSARNDREPRSSVPFRARRGSRTPRASGEGQYS